MKNTPPTPQQLLDDIRMLVTDGTPSDQLPEELVGLLATLPS